MSEQKNSPEPLEEALAAQARHATLEEDRGRMVEALLSENHGLRNENIQLNRTMERADARLKAISEKLQHGIEAYEEMREDLSGKFFHGKSERLEAEVEVLRHLHSHKYYRLLLALVQT
jgi:dynactin complex subunit